MGYKNIMVDIEGARATITLNRPEALNALNQELLTELETALRSIGGDSEVRVVILTGKGRAFCAGADMKSLESMENPQQMREHLCQIYKVHDLLESLGQPVIAALNGLTLAGGLELAMACDLIVASEEARIGDQHARYGLIPGGGATQRLPRRIGINRAKELLFTGKWITAIEAERIGLVNQVVPHENLYEAAAEMASSLAALSPAANKNIKQLVNKGMQIDLESALKLEFEAEMEHMSGSDAREGLAAFKEKRKPKFGGR